MSDRVQAEKPIAISRDGGYYMLPGVRADRIWLSLETFPLPVGPEWHYPNTFGAAVMRGRDYWRRFTRAPIGDLSAPLKNVAIDDPLVADYADAVWWTRGIEEAWAECARLHEAIAQHERNLAHQRSEAERAKERQ